MLIVLGLVLLVAAGGWTGYNIWDSERAGRESEEVLEQLLAEIGLDEAGQGFRLSPSSTQDGGGASDTQGSGTSGDGLGDSVPTVQDDKISAPVDERYLRKVRSMPTTEIDGRKYIGVLEIPSLNISLPVMYVDEWVEDRDQSKLMTQLKKAPCHYSGSYFADDLVICGHNYSKHFSPIKWIELDADIYFITVDGDAYHYMVDTVETLRPTQVKDMVVGDNWDLTLFTCNTGGQTRCAVRCSRVSLN